MADMHLPESQLVTPDRQERGVNGFSGGGACAEDDDGVVLRADCDIASWMTPGGDDENTTTARGRVRDQTLKEGLRLWRGGPPVRLASHATRTLAFLSPRLR